MSDLQGKVHDAVSFLTPEEMVGVLEGTLEAIESLNPGYTDHLILGILSMRAGMPPGGLYESKEH